MQYILEQALVAITKNSISRLLADFKNIAEELSIFTGHL